MKKILSLLLLLSMLLSLLPACRGEPPAETNAPASSSAGEEQSARPEKAWTAANLSEIAFQFSGFDQSAGFEHLYMDSNRERLAVYVENAYGLEEWEDAAVSRAAGASAFEVAVLRFQDEQAAARAGEALAGYLTTREGDFTGYAPAQADMAANGRILREGTYVGLFICPDPDGAEEAVQAALASEPYDPSPAQPPEPAQSPIPTPEPAPAQTPVPDPGQTLAPGPTREPVPASAPAATPEPVPTIAPTREPVPTIAPTREPVPASAPVATPEPAPTPVPSPTPAPNAPVEYPGRVSFVRPNIDDMSIYNTAAIRSAWAQGNPDGLSAYDRAIYDSARQILDGALQEGMSDLEKEEAVYEWIVRHVNYDFTHQDVMTPTPRASFTPYGALVSRKAVCLGFATAFQLLMDLSGVECITVVGASSSSREDHAWNMVRLDGRWYCVDVTWDANHREYGDTSGGREGWRYFNVTSDYMAWTNHQWDYSRVPET